ncbi:MAG: hypothetical protein ABIP08_12735 [Lautropia sp.]
MSTRTTAETHRSKAWIKSRTKPRNEALRTAIAALMPVLLVWAPATAAEDASASPSPARNAGSSVERYEGRAYARGSDRLLYRETHWLFEENGSARRLVLYRCPDGAAFARKWVSGPKQQSATGSVPASAPDFDFVDGRDGYREGVRTRAESREVYVQEGARSPERVAALAVPAGAVIDAGFDALVRARWDQIFSGGPVTVPFLVPSRLGFLDVRFSPAAAEFSAPAESPAAADATDARRDSRVRRLRLTLDHWFGFAVPAVELAYSARDRRLVSFSGIGSIRDGGGRNQDVRIMFAEADRVRDVSRQDMTTAANTGLVGQCGDRS